MAKKLVFCLQRNIFGQHIAAGLPPRLVMCDLRCWPHPLTPMMDDDSSTTYERACGFPSPSFTRIRYWQKSRARSTYVRKRATIKASTRRRRENEFKWATTRDRREQLVDQLDPEPFFFFYPLKKLLFCISLSLRLSTTQKAACDGWAVSWMCIRRM